MHKPRLPTGLFMFRGLDRLLGGLAVVSVALGVVPPVVSELRTVTGLHQHDVIRGARDALYGSLVLSTFVWLHVVWKADALRPAVRALGAVCAVSALLVGVVVWREAPQFWIVWPTYGQDFQFGVALWALAVHRPASTKLAAALTVTTGALVLSLPKPLLTSPTGVSAVVSFFVFLWLIGILPSIHQRIARVLRCSLVVCLASYSVMPAATEFVRLILAAVVLTELRAVVAPLADHKRGT